MSHRLYNQLWANVVSDLNILLAQELPLLPPPPQKDRVVFFQSLATLYVRYLNLMRQLDTIHDQLLHPQKRRLVKNMLDGVMGRLLEIKSEMVEIEYSEYHYIDDVIKDFKMMPADLDIPIPSYFIRERKKELAERQQMLSNIISSIGEKEAITKSISKRVLSHEDAIKIIQVAERARQGRLRAKFMREIQQDEKNRMRAKEEDVGPEALEQAAVCIQRVWKGYIQRKKTKKEKEEELIFLGMTLGPDMSQPHPSIQSAQAHEDCRRQKQEEYEEDYQKSIGTMTEYLRDEEGPDIKETMKEQIRQWYFECQKATGALPEIPDEEDGGSANIFAEKTPKELADELRALKEAEENEPNKKDAKKEKEKVDKALEEEEPGFVMKPSAFLEDLDTTTKIYSTIWQNRKESLNFSDRHDVNLIKELKRKDIEAEIRLQVDELMRFELAKWKVALEGDKVKKSAKKKKKKKTAKKKRKEKDLTADRTIESIYTELVEQGLLKEVQAVKLKDYLGEYSYLGTTLRQTDIEPMPSLSDVRQLIALYAVLPLGCQTVHEKAPLVKAMLLVGPAGVGKKMLVHAICQEAGANLFDLSPFNLTGKYPGKKGLQMMLHMVFKIARLMQPSVIWIGDAEKMFYKKVPKQEKELEPRRLKKDLPKALRTVKGEDRILVVGTTQEPYSGDIKLIGRMYQKIILIPRPDYASRFVMWRHLLKKHGGKVTKVLDLSSLAKISDGYTQGHIVQAIETILNERRLQQMEKKPITAVEFVPPLAKIDPVFQEEEEALKTWYAKTPLGKKRAKAAAEKEAVAISAKSKSKKTKTKGKK